VAALPAKRGSVAAAFECVGMERTRDGLYRFPELPRTDSPAVGLCVRRSGSYELSGRTTVRCTVLRTCEDSSPGILVRTDLGHLQYTNRGVGFRRLTSPQLSLPLAAVCPRHGVVIEVEHVDGAEPSVRAADGPEDHTMHGNSAGHSALQERML